MSMQRNTMALSCGSGVSYGWKTLYAALLTVWILLPYAHAQTNSAPTNTVLVEQGKTADLLYSMTFGGGSIGDFRRLWMETFVGDNFLINFSDFSDPLPEFQIRRVTLPELARSIVFLSKGALTIEVVEKSAAMPGNIWRVAKASHKDLSGSIRLRAVAAPHIFSHPDKIEQFLADARDVEYRMREVSLDLMRVNPSTLPIGAQIMVLANQRVFVVTGTEAGVSGMESFIMAAEQAAADKAKETKGKF
jgi:hypothetical protein